MWDSRLNEIVRRKILLEQAKFTRLCFDDPQAAKDMLLETVRAHLPPDYDIQTHFTPRALQQRPAAPSP